MTEFKEWLAVATKSLPKELCEIASQELEAHYTDYVATQLNQGKTNDEAHSAAIQALGDPSKTNWVFNQVQLSDKVYLSAAVASIFPPLVLGISVVCSGASIHNGEAFQQFGVVPLMIAVLLCMMYSLSTLKRTLNYYLRRGVILCLLIGLVGFMGSGLLTVICSQIFGFKFTSFDVLRDLGIASMVSIGCGLIKWGAITRQCILALLAQKVVTIMRQFDAQHPCCRINLFAALFIN